MNTAFKIAVFLLKRGYPLPIDLQTRLLDQGICIASLERRYGV